MKYTGGKSWFNKSTQEWEYKPRVYTDFYCSLKEWHNLGRGRLNFIKQVAAFSSKEYDEDGFWNSKNRSQIISNIINAITHRRPNVINYWEDELMCKDYIIQSNEHIEIEFTGLNMPNIIILYDKYESTESDGFYETIIDCIDCIYKILQTKTLEYYDNYLYQYYNNDYDYIFFKGDEDSVYYYNWYDKWQWKDVIKRKDCRNYTEDKQLYYK